MPIDLGKPVSDHPLNQGLLHWYLGLPPLAGGSLLEDIQGFSPATLTNGPLWDVDANNFPCLSFDGTNDYATAGDVDDVEGITALSISAFVLSTTLAGGTDGLRYITSKEDGGGLIWILRQLTGGDKLQWYCQTGAGTFGPQEVTGFTANTWRHVTATYQSGVGLDLYLDGVATSSTGFSTIGTLSTNTAPLAIGSLPSTSGRAWSGFISDVRYAARRYSQNEAWELAVQAYQGYPDLLRHYPTRAYFLPAISAPDYYNLTNVGLGDGSFSGASPWNLSTEIEAGAQMGGDLASPAPVTTLYETANVGVGLSSSFYSSVARIVTPAAGGYETSTVSLVNLYALANVGLGSSVVSTQVGGGPADIAGGRYRR